MWGYFSFQRFKRVNSLVFITRRVEYFPLEKRSEAIERAWSTTGNVSRRRHFVKKRLQWWFFELVCWSLHLTLSREQFLSWQSCWEYVNVSLPSDLSPRTKMSPNFVFSGQLLAACICRQFIDFSYSFAGNFNYVKQTLSLTIIHILASSCSIQ